MVHRDPTGQLRFGPDVKLLHRGLKPQVREYQPVPDSQYRDDRFYRSCSPESVPSIRFRGTERGHPGGKEPLYRDAFGKIVVLSPGAMYIDIADISGIQSAHGEG